MAGRAVLHIALVCVLPSFSAAKDNVALNAAVTAALGWNNASLANDGNVGNSTLATCFHSAEGAQYLPGWWRVDLGAVYPLDNVTIYFFLAHDIDRSSGMAVYVQNSTGSQELCTAITESRLRNKTVSCSQAGQILELRKTTTAPVLAIALCEVQVFVTDCASNSYSTGGVCTPCGHCLTGAVCDKASGACPAGCEPGWTRTRCDTGRFGAGCAGVCGHCPCHHVTGSCTGACESGWKGSSCNQTCQSGQYGDGCRETCGQCLQGTCHHVTGNCTGGCQPGWIGPRCDQICGSRTYGSNCAFTCGECLQQPCHHVNGSCFGGCRSGKTGDLCKEVCPDGTYGIGCANKCGLCVGVVCLDNGNCPGPCQDGWIGTACNQTCSAGRYGTNCSNTCGRCRDNAACNHVTGNCPAGCEAGWDGLRCVQECHDGTYWEGCTLTCGQCAGGVACDKKYGFCTACQEGFTPPLCQQDRASEYGSAYNQGLGTGVGIGIGVSCLVALIILAIVCIWHRRNQSQGSGRSKQHGRQSGEIRNADSSVYYNTAQEVAEAGDKAPYESLDAATRNANLPSHYEEIGNNRGTL